MQAIKNEELLEALKRIKALREWSVKEKINPWAVRQALIIGLEMDTVAAQELGITLRNIQFFDERARAAAYKYIRGLEANP